MASKELTPEQISELLEILSHKLKNPVHGALINLEAAQTLLEKTRVNPSVHRHLDLAVRELERITPLIKTTKEVITQSTDKNKTGVLKKTLERLK